MTKRDYKLIAAGFQRTIAVLRQKYEAEASPSGKAWIRREFDGVQRAANGVADALDGAEAGFKRQLFLDACRLGPKQKKMALPVPHEPEVHEREVRDVL